MKRHRARNIILIICLALLCVTGAELAACRHFAPEVYHRITDPVVCAAHRAADWGRSSLAAAGQAVDRLQDQLHDRIAEAAARREEARRAEEALRQEAAEPVSTPVSANAHDPAITALEQRDGRELLTGGSMPVVYFNQSDPAWAQLPYGSDTIGTCGCGPTAMAMVVATLTGAECDPASMAQWAYENHHWARSDGSYLSLVSGCAQAFGLTVEPIREPTPEALEDALYAGRLLVALMGPGHFTDVGHFILIRGCTLEGKLLVADPNSREQSLMEWEPQLLLDELSHKTADGGPLWAISAAE